MMYPPPFLPSASPLHARDLTVHVRDGLTRRTILDIPELTLAPGSVVGIHGPSGSGKTSLLRVLSGLRLPDSGTLHWGATDITQLPAVERDAWRGATVGFVFQDFRLFSDLSAHDNVLVPGGFRHTRTPEDLRKRAHDLLQRVGLTSSTQLASSLSRGEQQRVAIARALLFSPRLLLADEPTASLDTDNACAVMDILLEYAATTGATLCVVSHDRLVLNRLPHLLRLERGCLRSLTADKTSYYKDMA